jgi:hypothetical protein
LLGLALTLTVMSSNWAAAGTPDANGGGFADAGIEGAYYANPDLEGEPAFQRRDVRIDFDWSSEQQIGGSTAEPYRSFPRDRFSVRWKGRILARFDEDYTFVGDADDGIRVRIRREGETTWNTVVDRWDEPGPFQSEAVALRAGDLYEIEVDYRELNGDARCTLGWASASTGTETIDPVRQQGINVTHFQWPRYLWANAMKSARYGQGAEHIDRKSWPTQSGVEVVLGESYFPSESEMKGTYLFNFQGKAEVRQDCCVRALFNAAGTDHDGKLPRGLGYDAATNATTSLMTLDGSRSMLVFDRTQRTPSSRDDGVSDIRIMRPIAQGGSQPHNLDAIVYQPFHQVVRDHFTVIRLLGMAGLHGGDWAERTLPDEAFFIGRDSKENWEYLVMLANETGRDLYITIPVAADAEYVEKLALLLRYGSDGLEPYREPKPDPVYPGLNPNLRVYVEFDNEIWNWAFQTTQAAQELVKSESDRGTATWNIVDYDGRAGDPQHIRAVRRWHAVRTVQASQAFRRVWGDAKMGPIIRMVLEYQYDNYQDTALESLEFIDEYYGNRTSQHVADPHPVSHFLWGAGGAAYYGLRNGKGEQTDTVLSDADFEAAPLEPGEVRSRPRGSAWRFNGKSGLICSDEDAPVDGFEGPVVPSSGDQVAFLRGRGSLSQEVTFAAPGHYSVAFHAAGSGQGWPGYLPFDVLIDGRRVSPRNQSDPRVSPETAVIGGWGRGIQSLETEWGSAVFEIEKAGAHQVTFAGRGDDGDYLLLDDIRVASADSILQSGFAKGEAQGQEGEADFAFQLRAQSTYARAFGLQVVAYEAGWSVGGDLEQSPIQNWSKLHDPRVKAINDEAIELWDRSGSFLAVWGVYEYWPTYDFAHADSYPIMESFREAGQRLRYEATHGRSIPTILRPGDADWSYQAEAAAPWWQRFVPWMRPDIAEWHAWMLIAPKTGSSELVITGSGTGLLQVEVDGQTLGRLKQLGSSEEVFSLHLTRGAHAVRVVVVGGDLEIQEIEIR